MALVVNDAIEWSLNICEVEFGLRQIDFGVGFRKFGLGKQHPRLGDHVLAK